MKLIRKSDQAIVLQNGKVADGFLSRLRGLIGVTSLQNGEGLYFPRCNSIHMWMMSIPLDVLFLKKENESWRVLKVYQGVRPWKVLPVSCLQADDALELPQGSVARIGLRVGEVLCIAS